MQATFKGGVANGKTFTALQAGDTPPVKQGESLAGDTKFVGLGCDPLPRAAATA